MGARSAKHSSRSSVASNTGLVSLFISVKKGITRSFSVTGMVPVGLSPLFYVALEVSSRREQAKAGRKKLGVSVLAMNPGIPKLISAAGGLLSRRFDVCVWAISRPNFEPMPLFVCLPISA